MELTDVQKQAVKEWADQGLGLSDIQKRLEEEFSLKMTYMDVRFLVIDVGAELQDKKAPRADTQPHVDAAAAPAGPASQPSPASGLLDEQAPSASGVSVELDKLQKPGLLVSGSVTFSDGVSATWGLDQMGRLVLDAGDPTYKPSQEDIADFQTELRDLLAQRGF